LVPFSFSKDEQEGGLAILEVKLSESNIKTFVNWLDRFKCDSDDYGHRGILAGLEFTLTKLGLIEKVKSKQESTVEVSQLILNELIIKYKENKIDALWNIGHASAMYWVFTELNIPIT
jgi:hypothetical protein